MQDMRRLVEFSIYLAGVVFLSWNYYRIRVALDVSSFLVLVVFYLLGVSWFATWASHRITSKGR